MSICKNCTFLESIKSENDEIISTVCGLSEEPVDDSLEHECVGFTDKTVEIMNRPIVDPAHRYKPHVIEN